MLLKYNGPIFGSAGESLMVGEVLEQSCFEVSGIPDVVPVYFLGIKDV